jgi:hypothetical protein
LGCCRSAFLAAVVVLLQGVEPPLVDGVVTGLSAAAKPSNAAEACFWIPLPSRSAFCSVGGLVVSSRANSRSSGIEAILSISTFIVRESRWLRVTMYCMAGTTRSGRS